MAGEPPTILGRYERVKKTTRGRDPGWMESLASKEIKTIDEQEVKLDPVTGEYISRENRAKVAVNPGGPSLIVRGSGNATLRPGQAVPKEPVEFATLQDDYVKIPTNTTNYQRPRTVAAAWDPNLQTLTVIFRDSTFYNYYTVVKSEWDAFKDHMSPGEYIADTLDDKPRGPADVDSLIDSLGEDVLARAAQAARMAQLREGRKNAGFKPTPTNPRAPRTPQGRPRATGNVPNTRSGIIF
jgi:hypothetical protein